MTCFGPLTCSPASVGSALVLNARADSRRSRSARSIHIAKQSLKGTGPTCLATTTSAVLAETALEPTLFAEGFPAKTFQWREIAPGLRVRGQGYGESTPALLARYDHVTQLWKTSQACFLSGLETFSETWPRSGMTRNGTAYRLPPLVPLTSEIASGLLPTPRTSKQQRAWKA